MSFVPADNATEADVCPHPLPPVRCGLTALLALTFSMGYAYPATISVDFLDPEKPALVFIQGNLSPDDHDQFLAKISPLSKAIVVFQSDGGSVVAGVQIGETIRLKNFFTLVPENTRCASACALAFGKEKAPGFTQQPGASGHVCQPDWGDGGIVRLAYIAYGKPPNHLPSFSSPP
jgi:hypothetical protein